MSIRRRKKAISKVVKLLNLATSSNPSEATMALRHAETIVRQNSISRSEVPLSALCDPITLNKVKWGAKTQSTYTPKYARASSAASQQFNEAPVDKTHTYAGARTILDEEYVSEHEYDPIKEAARENEEREAEKLRKKAEKLNAEKARKAAELKEKEAQKAAREQAEKERLKAAAELQAERERQEIERYAAQAKLKMEHEQAELAKKNAEQGLLDEVQNDEIKADQVLDENAGMEIDEQVEGPHDIRKESEPMKAETISAESDVTSSASLNTDNVINAANAFRREGVIFSKQLKDQYAASDPTIPFEEDEYWQKVAAQLADFDEGEIQSSIDTIEKQLVLSKESLAEKRQSRLDAEQEELSERAERARIELSFEEAIERAFQARAKAYEAWEKQKSEIRVECLRSEQEAQHGYEELTQDLDRVKADFQQHVKRKQDFHAARIMHELRCHLALAVSVSGEGKDSFDKVVTIMSEAGLTLKDLEFSDIKNKSLFIRLLERETASIEDVVARESHTEEMLSKFLSSTLTKREPVKTENPLQQIEKLLGAASLGSQFEAQKSIEQAFHLMELHGISVRDIDLTKITKYSVFVRLLNWEAEKIPSLTEREKFTASILEEYVTSSIHGDTGVREKVSKNKA